MDPLFRELYLLTTWGGIAIALMTVGMRIVLPLLFPHQRRRIAPWSGVEVFLIFVLVMVGWPMAVSFAMARSGLNPSIPDLLGAAGSALAAVPSVQTEPIRRACLVSILSFPVQLATAILLPAWISGTRPYQLGLTFHRAGWNLLAGWAGAIFFFPLVYWVLFLTQRFYVDLLGGKASPHPLTLLGLQNPWIIFIPAVVAAPILEELLFRGLLQKYLMRKNWGAFVGLGAALLLALVKSPGGKPASQEQVAWIGSLDAISPAIFVLIMLVPFLLVWRWSPTRKAPTLFAVALLFAAGHSMAWPQPVPLFILGLGLGYLADRTQSLVAPMVMHATFNGVTWTALLVSHFFQRS